MVNNTIKPSRWFYVIPLVLLLGAAGAGSFLFVNIMGMQNRLERGIIPGEVELTISEPGSYTVFYEFQSLLDNKSYSTGENLPDLEYQLQSLTDGTQITLKPTGSRKTSYSSSNRSGFSVFQFDIQTPGVYKFSGQYPEKGYGEKLVFAIGQKVPFGKLIGGVALTFLLGFSGVGIFIGILVIRFSSKRRLSRS
jgi:hypothetical protein